MNITCPSRRRLLQALASLALLCPSVASLGDVFDHDFQKRVGDRAVFNTYGPACEINGVVQNENGDAFLESVQMANGDEFTEFYQPVAVHDFYFPSNGGRDIAVRGGTAITVGSQGKHYLGRMVNDGYDRTVSDADKEAFSKLTRQMFANNNLNNYIDMGGQSPYFEFIIEFNLALKDNDPEPDDFGELLYFERGGGGGNSWITLQAVDENGVGLGPELAISPHETLHTSPPTMVWAIRRSGRPNNDQYMGALDIDISRLGVTETQFLKVRRTKTSDSGWYSTGSGVDYNPDFKFMAVITHPDHLDYPLAQYD
ncbi:MAG: hypothetical protein V3V20_07915 [Algisphaera sp.]